jgi:hypothetical protein
LTISWLTLYSWDVALAVQWIFTNCNVGGGSEAVNGNGDLIISALYVDIVPLNQYGGYFS